MKNERDDVQDKESVIKKEEEEKNEEEGVGSMVEKKWNNFLESLGNCLGGRTSAAERTIERGNGSVVPVTLSTAVVRIWKFRTNDSKIHSIMLRHDHVFGTRTVELDGRKVHSSVGDGDLELVFRLCGEPGKLTIKTSLEGMQILFKYSCIYENMDVPPTSAYNVDKSTLDIYALCMPKYEIADDESVKYKIVSERAGSKCPCSVWRTYSEFSTLRFDLSSAFTGQTELLEKLPELPTNYAASIMFEPIEEEDVELTRRGLERFLIAVKKLPQTGSNPDLLRFLGIRQFVHQNARTATCAMNAMKVMSTPETRKAVRAELSTKEEDIDDEDDVTSYIESDVKKEALPRATFSPSSSPRSSPQLKASSRGDAISMLSLEENRVRRRSSSSSLPVLNEDEDALIGDI